MPNACLPQRNLSSCADANPSGAVECKWWWESSSRHPDGKVSHLRRWPELARAFPEPNDISNTGTLDDSPNPRPNFILVAKLHKLVANTFGTCQSQTGPSSTGKERCLKPNAKYAPKTLNKDPQHLSNLPFVGVGCCIKDSRRHKRAVGTRPILAAERLGVTGFGCTLCINLT